MDGISRFSLICTAVLACSAPGISSAQDFLNDSAPPIQLPDFTDVLAGREEVVIEQRIAPAPPATPGLRTVEHLELEPVPETAEPSEPALLETVSHEQIFSWPVIETCDGDGRFGEAPMLMAVTRPGIASSGRPTNGPKWGPPSGRRLTPRMIKIRGAVAIISLSTMPVC